MRESLNKKYVPFSFIAGYNYFGNERMYSGIDGREFEADIFFGVVYYQRLRHMVSDKFQVKDFVAGYGIDTGMIHAHSCHIG